MPILGWEGVCLHCVEQYRWCNKEKSLSSIIGSEFFQDLKNWGCEGGKECKRIIEKYSLQMQI